MPQFLVYGVSSPMDCLFSGLFFLSTGIGWNNWEFVVCTKFKSLLPHVIWPTQKLQSFAEGVSVFSAHFLTS